MKKILSLLLLGTSLTFSNDINIDEEAKKLSTYTYKTYDDDAEFQELDKKVPSPISIMVENLTNTISRPEFTQEEIQNLVIKNNFLTLKSSTEFDVEFFNRLANLDSRLKTPRTAEMLSFYFIAWGNQQESNNYLRVQRAREESEESIFQADLISVTEQLLAQFGHDATRKYVIEMKGRYPQEYLAQNWTDITL